MKTDNGFECNDFLENEHIDNTQETSVVYKFCLDKFQVKYFKIIFI